MEWQGTKPLKEKREENHVNKWTLGFRVLNSGNKVPKAGLAPLKGMEGAFQEDQRRAALALAGLTCFREDHYGHEGKIWGDKSVLKQDCGNKVASLCRCSKIQEWKKNNRPMEAIFFEKKKKNIGNLCKKGWIQVIFCLDPQLDYEHLGGPRPYFVYVVFPFLITFGTV